MAYMDREKAARVGHETVEILRAGRYEVGAKVVELRDAINASVRGTIEYGPDAVVPVAPKRVNGTRFSFENSPTLTAAASIAKSGKSVGALNFAAAAHPGGGFLSGSRAQEEANARSSALFACLEGRRMYAHHRELADALASDWAIFSPDVPVFRDDDGALREETFACSFLTCAAPNRHHSSEGRNEAVDAAFRKRVLRVLAIAAAHPHDVWIFGAWGCGAFGNESARVAAWFEDGLRGEFEGAFAEVTFAVVDHSPERRFAGPFEKRFGRQMEVG